MKKFLLAALFSVFLASPAVADDLINPYEIKDIAITNSGDSAAAMRDAAITEGQRKAMNIFQQRLRAKKLLAEPIEVTDEQISEAIDSIEVRDEKIFTKSYKARLNVVFSKHIMSKIFNISEIKATPVPDKFLVLPILNDSEGTKIWRHKWWDVMQKIKDPNIIMPLGDLEDVRNFTREDYSVRDFRNINKLQKKYNTTAIILAVAEYIPSEKSINLGLEKIKGTDVDTYNYELTGNGNNSEIELYALAGNELLKRVKNNDFEGVYRPDIEEETTLIPPKVVERTAANAGAAPKGTSPDVYQKNTPRTETTTITKPNTPTNLTPSQTSPVAPPDDRTSAASASSDIIMDESEIEPAVDPQEEQLTDVYVIANDLVAWGRVRQKITNTELVTNLRIKSFTAGKAFITLTHKGDFTQVITMLENAGMEVSRPSKYWEIRERKQ